MRWEHCKVTLLHHNPHIYVELAHCSRKSLTRGCCVPMTTPRAMCCKAVHCVQCCTEVCSVSFEKHPSVQCVQCAVEQCGHCAAQQCACRCPRPGNGQVSSKSVRTALVCNGVNQSNAVNNGHDWLKVEGKWRTKPQLCSASTQLSTSVLCHYAIYWDSKYMEHICSTQIWPYFSNIYKYIWRANRVYRAYQMWDCCEVHEVSWAYLVGGEEQYVPMLPNINIPH